MVIVASVSLLISSISYAAISACRRPALKSSASQLAVAAPSRTNCIDAAAIREGWDEALRVGVSIEVRIIAPSTVLKALAALPKANMLSRALREIGRIERTLFMIEWYSSPELRDRYRAGLNEGEAGDKLTRAVFFHERGEIRDGSFESQALHASGLNLVVDAIVLSNTVDLSRAVESLRAEGHDLPDDVIRHISPQIWEHINLTGIYDWMGEPQPEGIVRPLRIAKEKLMAPPDPRSRMFLLCSTMSYSYAQFLSSPRGVHLLGQRAEGDPARLEVGHRG